MFVFPVPPLLCPPVLAELQANLITSEECKMQPPSDLFFSRYVLQEQSDISGVVRVQSYMSPEVMSKSAEVLRRHGFEKESRLLAGRQSRPSFICLCYVVQWSLLMTATL